MERSVDVGKPAESINEFFKIYENFKMENVAKQNSGFNSPATIKRIVRGIAEKNKVG